MNNEKYRKSQTTNSFIFLFRKNYTLFKNLVWKM